MKTGGDGTDTCAGRTSLRVVSVVGARPQFVKAAALSPAMRRAGIDETLVHTGQHYDWEMSATFFEGLSIPAPDVYLGVGSAPHGAQTGRILEGLEHVLEENAPDAVVVYGDTNSTLAGALAGAKMQIPVVHVEAGLRSFDRRMPEEVNRVVTDHVSSLLFAPTATAVRNLAKEGLTRGVVRTGDVMYNVAVAMTPAVEAATSEVLERFCLRARSYAFVTVHRAENTNDAQRWRSILSGLAQVAASGLAVVWPAHPRASALLEEARPSGVRIERALPYLETQCLLGAARVVLTDSGGLQKEAAFRGVPCVTLRDATEWVELLDAGLNTLVGADPEAIVRAASEARWPSAGLPPALFGDGRTSSAIAEAISANLLMAREHTHGAGW